MTRRCLIYRSLAAPATAWMLALATFPSFAQGYPFGVLKGKIRYPDDFDAPFPARVLALFEGRRAK